MKKPHIDIAASAAPSIADSPTTPRARAIAITLLLAGAVAAGMGQTIVFSVLPPLARDIGMTEMQVGLIFMISALCWVSLGPLWGRRSDRVGRKIFILLGLLGFAISMALFGATIQLGLAGVVAGMPLYLLLVLTRSFYGILGSAGPPAAQAYIADRTSATDRTAGLSGFAAAFGFGAMIGPAFGAATSSIGPVAPFFAMALLAGLMSGAVFFFLPERTRPSHRDAPRPVKIMDARIRSILFFGLIFGVVNAIPIQTIAFYFIDALGYGTDEAPQYVGVALTGSAMASLFAQLVLVQRFKLEPHILMRVAPILLLTGHGLIWLSNDFAPVVFGMVLGGLGSGLAYPGFNAAASLAVESDEQGAAIGLSGSAGASGFIISPILAFGLYAVSPAAPFMFSTALGAFLLVFALRSRAIGAARPKPSSDSEAIPQPPTTPLGTTEKTPIPEDEKPVSAPYS